jgi:hypothetical protein
VVRRVIPGETYSLDDGLGIRAVATDGRTVTEVLELAPTLASQPVVEQAIRGRASRFADLEARSFAVARRIERTPFSLRIVSEMPTGVRLSHLLAHLESTGEVVPESATLELASLVVNALASLHSWPGGLAHGAINPAHIVLTNDGRVVITDCVFGGALEALQRNREQLWKDFSLAMPAAASLPRFDQQSDVTQLGALVLAIVLQRPLRVTEYPRGVSDLVLTATEAAATAGRNTSSALRMWLQEALQTHPRLAFRSAVEAQRSFSDINSAPGARRAAATALQVLLRTTCGVALDQPKVVVTPPPSRQELPAPVHRVPTPASDSPGAFDSILRAVFPKHGPN